MRKRHLCVLSLSLLVMTSLAMASTVGSVTSSPVSFYLDLNASSSGPVSTQVNITDDPGAGEVSVFFLTDTTGSMGGYIGTIKSAFSTVASDLSTSLPAVDWHWGVADYKDFEDGGLYASGIRVGQSLTSSIAAAQTAINAYGASGGGDTPEQNLASLKILADGWVSSYGGRASAQRILVWAGDIQGWENGAKGYPYPTLQATIDALTAQGVQVFGLNSRSAGAGIDAVGSSASPGGAADGRHQASAITAATGGQLFNNASSGTAVSDAIKNAITTGVDTVGQIALTLSGDLGDWALGITGTPVIGPFGSSVSPVLSNFGLDVTAPGYSDSRTVYLQLRADGAVLDEVPVLLSTAMVSGVVPEPATMLGLTLAAASVAGYLRRRRA